MTAGAPASSFTAAPGAGGLTAAPLFGQAGLRLTGEADASTIGILREAASALPEDAAEIHLHLITLEFIDARAAGELVALTRRPRRPQLILHYPPLLLPRLISILWPEAWDRISVANYRGVVTEPGDAFWFSATALRAARGPDAAATPGAGTAPPVGKGRVRRRDGRGPHRPAHARPRAGGS
jgi:hypothetical protein